VSDARLPANPETTPGSDQPKTGSKRLIGLGIGWGLTACWITCVLLATRADPDRPLFDTIFAVPLAGWIVAFVVRHLATVVRGRQPSPTERR
jgi:hypothetical protein